MDNMNQMKKLQQEIAEFENRLQKAEQKKSQLEARYRKRQNEIQYKERRQRTHRLISIGAEVESVFGCPVQKEDLPAFREYMKKAVTVLGAFRVIDGQCSFLLP